MTTRRKPICGRSLDAGPGSCHYWWEGCPDRIGHCIIRFVESHRELKDAPQEEQQAALDRWSADRDRALEPQPGLI